jgi:hypothetical protein
MEGTDVRSDSTLDNLLRDMSQTIPVDLVISLIYGEIKTVCSIDLDV